jgi:hypothetical protein
LYEVDALQRQIAERYRQAARERVGERIIQIDGTPGVRAVQRACRAALQAFMEGEK